tara:strand:+ start:7602 stop:7847 length:246 start_codon:yes stop_codon:yes gene_type:complete
LEAMLKHGLSIKSAKGDFQIEDPKAGESCDPNFNPDLVIVAVKSWQLPEITAEIKKITAFLQGSFSRSRMVRMLPIFGKYH